MFSLQYLSDIHLEFNKEFRIPKILSPNIVLCGDIGNLEDIHEYVSFIKECAIRFKNVFLVFGNHEFYSKQKIPMTDLKQTLHRHLSDIHNVYILDNKSLYINIETNHVFLSRQDHHPQIRLIGTTLWSDVDQDSWFCMNDCRLIFKKHNERLTRDDVVHMFYENKTYIKNELLKDPSTKTILITHHGVHHINNQGFETSSLCSAFVSDISDDIFDVFPNIIASISGHTHVSVNHKIKMKKNNQIHFLSNQLGYPDETRRTNYNPDSVFLFDENGS